MTSPFQNTKSQDGYEMNDTSLELGKNELKAEFIELRAKGYSYGKIAKKLKVSKTTLTNWNAFLSEEIARLKAIELESLQERYYLLKEGRIKLLGDLCQRLKKELKSRDLSEVPTDKLLELLLRYYSELKAEYVEPLPLSDMEIAELRRLEDKTGTKLDSGDIAREIHQTLLRYRAGIIDKEQATKELSLLMAMLKAHEQSEIEEKLDRIEAVLLERRE